MKPSQLFLPMRPPRKGFFLVPGVGTKWRHGWQAPRLRRGLAALNVEQRSDRYLFWFLRWMENAVQVNNDHGMTVRAMNDYYDELPRIREITRDAYPIYAVVEAELKRRGYTELDLTVEEEEEE